MQSHEISRLLCLFISLFYVISVDGRSVLQFESETRLTYNETENVAHVNKTETIFKETENLAEVNNNQNDTIRRQQKQDEGDAAEGAAGGNVASSVIKTILDIPVARETVFAILKAISSPFDYISNAVNGARITTTEAPPPTTTQARFVLLQIPG